MARAKAGLLTLSVVLGAATSRGAEASGERSEPAPDTAAARTIVMSPGQTEEVLYPSGTDLAVSRRGVIDAFPSGEGRWELTALRAGFVVVDAKDAATGDARWPRLLIDVRPGPAAAPSAAPEPVIPAWICRAPGISCDQDAGIVRGTVASAAWLAAARGACLQGRGCRLLAQLTPAALRAWLAELGADLGSAYAVSATRAGVPLLDVYCGRGGRARRFEEADLLTGRSLSAGLALLRCRDETATERFRLSLRAWLVEDGAARSLGLLPEAGGGIAYPPASGDARLLARLRALEQERKAEVLGQPVLRLAAGREAELTAGGEFQVIDHIVREPVGTELPERSSWKEHGLTLKVAATPLNARRVRLAYDLTLKTRTDQSDASLTVNTLKSELDLQPGAAVMVGILDVRSSGRAAARLPILSGLPLIGPLLSDHDGQETRSRLILWMRLDPDEDAPTLPLPLPDATGPPDRSP